MRGGPVILTVVISAALHVALATGLVAVAKNRDVRHRAISVAVEDAKKKEAKPKPPTPPSSAGTLLVACPRRRHVPQRYA